MNRIAVLLLISLSILFSSCELSCSLGNKKVSTSNSKKEPRIFNAIELKASEVEIEKAYLIFKDGEAVPAGNAVDFSQPVKIIFHISKGWTEKDNVVMLGAAEKIEVENGQVLLDEKDLFAESYPDGMSETDSKTLALSADILVRSTIPAKTAFKISFYIWDKNGEAFIEGSYNLYAK